MEVAASEPSCFLLITVHSCICTVPIWQDVDHDVDAIRPAPSGLKASVWRHFGFYDEGEKGPGQEPDCVKVMY